MSYREDLKQENNRAVLRDFERFKDNNDTRGSLEQILIRFAYWTYGDNSSSYDSSTSRWAMVRENVYGLIEILEAQGVTISPASKRQVNLLTHWFEWAVAFTTAESEFKFF